MNPLLLLSACNLRYSLFGFPQPVVQVAGVGIGFFKDQRLIIDYPGKRLFL